jgi:hypothetical protein
LREGAAPTADTASDDAKKAVTTARGCNAFNT